MTLCVHAPRRAPAGTSTVLTLDAALKYAHLGERFTGPDGRVVDMRAEVAVLTRNVVVQASLRVLHASRRPC